MTEHRSSFGRDIFQDGPNGVAGNHRQRPTEIKRPRNNFHRNKTPNTLPSVISPRFQNKSAECAVAPPSFCNPPPIPCPGVIDPCLPSAAPSCSNEQMTLQIKHILGLATCPDMPVQIHHPIGNPTLPSHPQKAEVASPPPTIQVDLSRPPGLPRPNSFRGGDNRSSVRDHMERLDDSRFEHHNGPVVARGVISPPPPSAVPKAKLPGSNVVPRSPSTASSSLSDDPSGSSVAFKSDTTFTSVDTSISDKVIMGPNRTREICRNYMRGCPCFMSPCRLFHPRRIDLPDNVPKQPTEPIPAASYNAHKQPMRQTPVVSETRQTIQQTPAAFDNTPKQQTRQAAHANAPKQPTRHTPVASDNLPKQATQQISAACVAPPKQSTQRKPAASDDAFKRSTRHTTIASDNASKQPTQQTPARPDHDLRRNSTRPAPAPQYTVKTSTHVGGPRNGAIPPKHDRPSSTDAEPPPKPSEPPYATTISDHIKVRFDAGFEVRDVVTGFESRWVHLGNISGSVTSAALNELLAPFKADPVNLPESLGKPVVTVKVQFASPVDAIKAVTDLNGVEFAGKTISAKSAINNSHRGGTVVRDTVVQLIWEYPSRVGYVGYDTLKEAVAAMESINGKPCGNLIVIGQLYEGLPCIGAFNVIFKHIPANMTEQGLRKFASSTSVMLGRPNYDSLDKAVKCIRSRLEEYGTLIGFDLIDPPFRDGTIKAWAQYTTPAEAQAAQNDFNRRRPKIIGHTVLSCRHVVSISHVLNASIYQKMREDIGWLRNSWHFRYGPFVNVREKTKDNAEVDGPVHIKISCDQSETLSVLKYEFEQMLRGEAITLENKPIWDDFLAAPAGHIFIANVQAEFPGIHVEVQSNRRIVILMGPITMRQRARAEIVRKISELKALQVWKIPLSGRALPIFLSAELSNLQELVGSENCMLDCDNRMLMVRGNDEAFRLACTVIQTVQSRQEVEDTRSDAICPVCFGEAIVPVTLACGHRWCRACLSGYLTSAVENKLFPLRCLGNDATCTQCIPLGLSRKVLPTADFNAVLKAAFWVYVHGRPGEFFHCPTPDCAQVYRAAPRNAVLQCPSCLVRICPACQIVYHDGMTCEERDVADDKLFKAWTMNHDVKCCPGCKAPIERSEGCNHMTCTRCQTHICWECLATFPRGQGIYDHMRVQHGGIGL